MGEGQGSRTGGGTAPGTPGPATRHHPPPDHADLLPRLLLPAIPGPPDDPRPGQPGEASRATPMTGCRNATLLVALAARPGSPAGDTTMPRHAPCDDKAPARDSLGSGAALGRWSGRRRKRHKQRRQRHGVSAAAEAPLEPLPPCAPRTLSRCHVRHPAPIFCARL